MMPMCGQRVSGPVRPWDLGVTLEGTGPSDTEGLLEPSFSHQDHPLTAEGRAGAPWGPRAVA